MKNHLLLFNILSFFSCICFATGMPRMINPPGERLILVDPRIHAWAAYTPDGLKVKDGLASAGANWCADIHSQCHTEVGAFRINSIGDSSCKSPSFPLPKGGAPMPYCMYFTPYQAIHGSPKVVYGNISHGCVRLRVNDAKWIRNNFASIGTLVVVRPY